MRFPDFLPEKGIIGFVAPSFGCATEPYASAFANAREKFASMGYGTKLGSNCLVDKGIGISNEPRLCARELNDCYADPDMDVLISCGGGELMCEILPYVDFEKIAAEKPKWFMGYSDNTNFTFLSTTLCDTAAIYGPCAAAFGMEPWHESIQDAFDVLRGKTNRVHNYDKWEMESLKDEAHPLEPYHVTEPVKIRRFPDREAEFSGRLIGGCMDTLVTLAGTRFDRVKEFCDRYQEDGIIWFLEACDLNVMGIRRAVWQMKNAGWFCHAKGFLIGRPYCFGQEMFGLNQYRAVTEPLEEFGVPVIMDLDIGHHAPMMPVISGAYAKVSAGDNSFSLEYAL